jgi:hypothetical protein
MKCEYDTTGKIMIKNYKYSKEGKLAMNNDEQN